MCTRSKSANSTTFLQAIVSSLSSEFSMTDMGPLHHFLGIHVTRNQSGLHLSQAQYASDLLHRNSLLHLLRSPIRRTTPRPCKPILSSQFYSQSSYITSFFRDKARPLRTHSDSNSKKKSANKALRVLSLISLKTAPRSANEVRHAHLRVIEDFLQTQPEQPINAEPPTTDPEFGSLDLNFNEIRADPLDRALDLSPGFESSNPIQLLRVLQREGLMRLSDTGLFAVSRSLGACVAAKDIHFGVQLHCLSIRCGFLQNVYVGTSLVSLYGKCGKLGFACKLFDEMPERNIVSWSALISGFAQDWQVDVCFDLYIQMRQSGVQPNDYTLTALLSACMGSGSLGMGRIIHCQAIQLGFNSDVTVLNAIISLYCKCGDLHDASCVFNAVDYKDIISWNSIIAGYSLHGLALQTTELFEEMRRRGIKPDAITFLNVLSSCRHAGLVDQGRYYFNSMKECGVEPILDHYSCLVDLLGRAGLLEEARDVVINMPMQPNAVVWGALLSCCSSHGNISIGIEAAKNRLALNPGCPSTHLQLSNLYARLGKWDETAKMRKIMKDRVLKTNPGCSWIEIGSSVYRFKADDTSNAKMMEVLDVLEILKDHLAVSDYVIETSEEILDCL
ncbi:hypothetical protein V2J09_006724 [Rumex salicifolius]